MPASRAVTFPRRSCFLRLRSDALRRRRARFVIRLEGDKETLDVVCEVPYYLHPTYGVTVHDVKPAPFTLDIPRSA